MSADDPAVGPPERLHPLFLVTGLGRSLRGLAGGYAGIGYLAATGRIKLALIAAVVLFVVMAISLFLYWRHFEFRVGANEIRIDSGILNRTHRSIPFDRIQDVDITQGPLARLLGLAKVKLETGSAGTLNKDEGILHAVALDRAEQLRAVVRSYRAPVATARATAAEAKQLPIYAMGLRRVLLAGLFSFSLALFGGLAGLTQTVGNVIGFDPFSRSFWRGASEIGGPVTQFLMANAAASAIAGIVVLAMIGLATGVVRSVLRDYRFRLDRTARALRRRRGLLTLTDVTLPLARVQAAITATGPVRRAFGWFDLKLQSLAQDETGKGDHVVAPLAHRHEIAVILEQLQWPPGPAEPEWRHVSRAYLYLFLAGMVAVALLGAAQAIVMPLLGAVIIAVAAVASLLRIGAWPRTRYALDGGYLFVEGGWWRQHRLLLPLAKVQSADVSETALTRLFGIATLRLGVAGGGKGFSGHEVPALPRETAFALRAALVGGA